MQPLWTCAQRTHLLSLASKQYLKQPPAHLSRLGVQCTGRYGLETEWPTGVPRLVPRKGTRRSSCGHSSSDNLLATASQNDLHPVRQQCVACPGSRPQLQRPLATFCRCNMLLHRCSACMVVGSRTHIANVGTECQHITGARDVEKGSPGPHPLPFLARVLQATTGVRPAVAVGDIMRIDRHQRQLALDCSRGDCCGALTFSEPLAEHSTSHKLFLAFARSRRFARATNALESIIRMHFIVF